MGRSITPTYRIEFRATGGYHTPSAWRAEYGRPSAASLARWVESFEASTREGGVNAHLGVTTVWSARIVRQATGAVVADYAGPAFAMAA